MRRYLLGFLLIMFTGIFSALQAKVVVKELTCEYRQNPIGLDVQKPRLSWKLYSEKKGVFQTAYEIRVATSMKDLRHSGRLLWTSGKIKKDRSTLIPYTGPQLKAGQRVYWMVRVWDNDGSKSAWSKAAYWEASSMTSAAWTSASWISAKDEGKITSSLPAQYYRKRFSLNKKVASARVYVTSLGTYQLYLNGQKVSKDLFAPGWTSYNKRLQYQTYDVSNLLTTDNVVGAIVGDGWYRGILTWNKRHAVYGSRLALLMSMRIQYTDGSEQLITTDDSWHYSYGSIVSSDIYNGECYDFNKKMTGWDQPNYAAKAWESVEILNHSKKQLVATVSPMPEIIKEIKPVKMIVTPKGEVVADLGQNMVGWIRLKVKGMPGDTVKLSFAEVLDKKGNFYTANLRAAKATDYFILGEKKEYICEPHFTFHGFRYICFEGMRKKPKMEDITGMVIHTPMTQTGSFTCSDTLVNQLQHNIEWGQRSNFLDIPTDCPQRDERLGWTGDTQVFSMTAAYNFEVANFYTKWLKDLALDQTKEGKVPHVIPDVLSGQGGSTAWADASIIVPWTVYRSYGDTCILSNQYESMRKWVTYMEGRAGTNYLWQGDSHFGDWLAFASNRSDYTGATTEKDLIATAYFAFSSSLLSKVATVLGKKTDAAYFKSLSEKVKRAFNSEFVTPNGRLVSHTQTAYLLALKFDLLPNDLRKHAAHYLAEDVEKFKHLTTGFVGTPLLCSTLSDIGRDDLAFKLLMRKEYPSWLYPVTQGATTIWERWDGQKPDGSFQTTGMNSFNHYAYGAIGEWMYNYILGIQDEVAYPGYKHFLLSPHVGGGLTYAKGHLETMYGPIRSDWKIDKGEFVYTIEIPVNTSAQVVLPHAALQEVSLNGKSLADEVTMKAVQRNDETRVRLGSGTYQFVYPYK